MIFLLISAVTSLVALGVAGLGSSFFAWSLRLGLSFSQSLFSRSYWLLLMPEGT